MGIQIGKGCLLYEYKNKLLTDGVVYYRVLSPFLWFRLAFNKRNKRNIDGAWLVIGDIIVWFHKIKYYHHHTKLGETYHREEIRRSNVH